MESRCCDQEMIGGIPKESYKNPAPLQPNPAPIFLFPFEWFPRKRSCQDRAEFDGEMPLLSLLFFYWLTAWPETSRWPLIGRRNRNRHHFSQSPLAGRWRRNHAGITNSPRAVAQYSLIEIAISIYCYFLCLFSCLFFPSFLLCWVALLFHSLLRRSALIHLR